jgi:hypothetical protein
MLAYLTCEEIRKAARKSGINKHSKKIDAWTHLFSMIFWHLVNAGLVHEISNGLRSMTGM